MYQRAPSPHLYVIPAAALLVDVSSRLAARLWLAWRDIDLGALTLMLRIHRSTTFFPLLPLAPVLQALLGLALIGVLLVVGLIAPSVGGPQRVGALLAACGGLANGIELLCCGVSDVVQLSALDWHSPIFNLGDANLVIGMLLLFFAPRPAKVTIK